MFLELRMSAEYLWLTHSALFNGEMHCSHPQGAATIFAANPFHSPRERDALQPPTIYAANPFCSLKELDQLQQPKMCAAIPLCYLNRLDFNKPYSIKFHASVF